MFARSCLNSSLLTLECYTHVGVRTHFGPSYPITPRPLGAVCKVLYHVWPSALGNENMCYKLVNVFTRMFTGGPSNLKHTLYWTYMKTHENPSLVYLFNLFFWLDYLKLIHHRTKNRSSPPNQCSQSEHTAPQGPVLHWLSADGTFQLLCPGWRPGSCGYP